MIQIFIYLITAYFPDSDMWKVILRQERGVNYGMYGMRSKKPKKGYTTSVTDLGNCLLIVHMFLVISVQNVTRLSIQGMLLKDWKRITRTGETILHRKFLL